MRNYLYNIFVAADQTINAVLGGNPDETLSSRLRRMQARGSRFAAIVCWLLSRIDRGHCAESDDQSIP